MLSKPNVKEIMPKIGNRYQSVLALAKRARQIEADTVAKRKELKEKNKEKDVKEEIEENIFDAIDIAANEVANNKIYVKINGEYAITPEAEMEREIKEAQEKAKLEQQENRE